MEKSTLPEAADGGRSTADGVPRTQAELARALAGDASTMGALWQRCRPALVVLLITRFRGALEPALRARFDDELDDILQETAAQVVAGLGTFTDRGHGSLLAWMSTIAVRTADDRLDYWRAGKRHPRRVQPMAEGDTSRSDARGGIDAFADSARTPGSAAAVAERRRRIAAALAGLSERHQQIVAMRFFGGVTWQEVAACIGAKSGDAVAMECLRQIFPHIAAGLAAIDRDRPPSS